ncbi:MAG TPA: T9SS type A sorting domain-containing protein [Chitinophagales bacterium]|nr:T9SS type A sorting domain-containing protein [Chitinophagales bacterium]
MKNKIYSLSLLGIFIAVQLTITNTLQAQNCCLEATGLHTSGIAPHTVTLNFSYSGITNCEATKFKVQYRIKGSNDPWTKTSVPANNTNTYSVIIGFLESNTKYSWQVKTICDNNGTTLRSNWTAKNYFTTLMRLGEMNDVTTASIVNVYPNPLHDILWIEKQIDQPSDVSLSIYDLMGKKVFSSIEKSVDGNFSRQLNIANLPSGIYSLEVITNGEKSVSKIVKQ